MEKIKTYQHLFVFLYGKKKFDFFHKSLAVFAAACLPIVGWAQYTYVSLGDAPKKALQAYEDGQYYMREKEWAKAETALQKATQIAPAFIDAHWQLAELYYQHARFAEAEAAYRQTANLSTRYRPQVLFTLGLLQEKQEKWQAAAEFYAQFVANKRDATLLPEAAYRAAYCAFRAQAYANPVPFAPSNLGPNINNGNNQYLPSLSLDGNTLLFTEEVGARQEDFFKSEKVNGVWQTATNLGPPINTPYNEGAQTIAANGKTIVFAACNRPDGLGRCDLYLSDYKNGAWTTPKNMGAPINTPYWEGHASLSADGNTLYLSTDRPNGTGGSNEEDIWVAHRANNGVWQTPTPLSNVINGAKAERSPFIHPDGVTLYFSSNSHAGMGKADLFVSRKDSAGNWSKPRNLGYPINTAGADWSLIVAPDGKTAYYSAQRIEGIGGMDLYTFELPDYARATPTTFLHAVVFDADTHQKLPDVTCQLTDLHTQQAIATVRTDSGGELLLPLPVGKAYALHTTHTGYLFYTNTFVINDLNTVLDPYELRIDLRKIPAQALTNNPKEPMTSSAPTALPPAPIVLKNIFFDTNTATLKSTSFAELGVLLQLLLDNPTLCLQLNGHTDNVGAAAANTVLSQRRAEAVRDYLLARNIAPTRLRAQGFGESQPIDTNDTPIGRANNRRTEMQVLPNVAAEKNREK